jgi:D-lactate dehydrogenase
MISRMPDVFFYEAFKEEADALRALLPTSISAEYSALTIQECGHATPPARMISARTQSVLPRAWASQLDAILSRSTGYDHLAAYAAEVETPPALGYLPLYCHRAVAEQAMLLWMALLRKLPRQIRQFRDFHRDGLTGLECDGRTLVVVGVGNIGHEIYRIGQALGMRVFGVDRDPRLADVVYLDVKEAFPQADIVVCAMDLNRTSRGCFDDAKWKLVKPGALFVNVSRGELSPSTALLAALQAGRLGGVALDVYDHEAELAVALRSGRPSDDPEVAATLALAQRDDCICTPHNAFNSAEGTQRKSEHSVRQILAFREHGRFLWAVPPTD